MANIKDQIAARRRTYDNQLIVLWADGDITRGITGTLISRRVPMAAAWLVMDELCLYDYSEVKGLIKTARRAIKQKRLAPLEYLRQRANAA